MKLVILPAALDDLADGFEFYEKQEAGLGGYFLNSLFAEIDSLKIFGGIHRKIFGFQRLLAKRFPFAIYYEKGAEQIFCPRRAGLSPRSKMDPAKIEIKLWPN